MAYPLTQPVFQPAMRLLISITQANPAVVTVTPNHLYQTGLIVRFDIPFVNGMQQLNQQTATITVTGATTFTIPIDTTNYDPLVVPLVPTANNSQAQCVPIGEDNSILTQAVFNALPY